MRFHMRGVDHLCIRGSSVPGELPEQILPDTAPRPADKPVINRGRRTIFRWAIAPAAPTLEHMHDAAYHAPVVHPFDASHIGRQVRLDSLPLLIV